MTSTLVLPAWCYRVSVQSYQSPEDWYSLPGVLGSVFSHTSDLNIGTPCLAPGVTGSVFSHTSDLNIGTLVAVLPGAWHCRVRAGTGLPDVSTV